MQNDKQQAKEAIRKLIASALCDLIAYMGSVKDPFIVGGQYPNDKLIEVFHKWLFSKKFDIKGVDETAKTWFKMYQQNMFAGSRKFVTPPEPPEPPEPSKLSEPSEPSEPPPGTLPPMPPALPQTKDDIPDDGYFNDDEWKPKEDRKKRWTEEGEDWKKGKDDEFQSV